MLVLGSVAALALLAFVVCSRSPAPHVGEWGGNLYFKNFTDPREAYFLFQPDDRVVHHLGASAGEPEIHEGRCRFEYDEVPPHLHVEFANGTKLNGLVYFSGREKNTMFIGVGADALPRHFADTQSYYLLVKKAKRDQVASKWKRPGERDPRGGTHPQETPQLTISSSLKK